MDNESRRRAEALLMLNNATNGDGNSLMNHLKDMTGPFTSTQQLQMNNQLVKRPRDVSIDLILVIQ